MACKVLWAILTTNAHTLECQICSLIEYGSAVLDETDGWSGKLHMPTAHSYQPGVLRPDGLGGREVSKAGKRWCGVVLVPY